MVPFDLKYTVDSAQGIVNFTMDVDMLAHFDEWQRSNKDDEFEAEDQWPLELRRARVITAVDYIQVYVLILENISQGVKTLWLWIKSDPLCSYCSDINRLIFVCGIKYFVKR